ncbi:MAG: family 20 glycosylhydrolase, partial [Mucinivorans sp.]
GRLRIEFADSLGLQWARSTLGQMEDEYHRLPSEMTIEDYPATAIRGFMHDTGRNFIDLPTIKRHLWLMSFYKFNTFQW